MFVEKGMKHERRAFMPTKNQKTVIKCSENFNSLSESELNDLIAMKLISGLFEYGAITEKEYCRAISKKK